MNKQHKASLSRNRLELINTLTSNLGSFEKLVNDDMKLMLTDNIREEINCEERPSVKVRIFLDVLPKRGEKSWVLFISVLKEMGFTSLSDKLLDGGKSCTLLPQPPVSVPNKTKLLRQPSTTIKQNDNEPVGYRDKPTDKDLLKISKLVGFGWQRVGIMLNIKYDSLRLLEQKRPDNSTYSMLLYWAQNVQPPYLVTNGNLARALFESDATVDWDAIEEHTNITHAMAIYAMKQKDENDEGKYSHGYIPHFLDEKRCPFCMNGFMI